MVDDCLKQTNSSGHLCLARPTQTTAPLRNIFDAGKITSLDVQESLLSPGSLKGVRNLRCWRGNRTRSRISSSRSDNVSDIERAALIDNNPEIENVMLSIIVRDRP